MKYFIAIFITAVLVFIGATIYYKGLPSFPKYGENAASTEAPVSSAAPSASPADETLNIKIAMTNALAAKWNIDAKELNVSVSKVEGEYASGTLSAQGGGGGWYAARVNGNWTLVWDGNGQIDCTDISPYPEFPKDMIPECWDVQAKKLIVR